MTDRPATRSEQLSRAEMINWLDNSPLAAGWQSPADCGARSPGNPASAVRTLGPGSDSQPGASCSGRYAPVGGALGRLRGGGLRCARLTAPRAGRRARSLFQSPGQRPRPRAGWTPADQFRGLRQSFVAILVVARCNVREVSEIGRPQQRCLHVDAIRRVPRRRLGRGNLPAARVERG
jgi:hypothetical protein